MAARGGLGKPCSGGHVRAGFLVPLPSLPACPPCFHSLVQDQGGLCTALHPESFGSPEPPPSPPAAWPTHPGGWEEGRQAVNGKASVCLTKVLAEGRALFPLPRWLPLASAPLSQPLQQQCRHPASPFSAENDCWADIRLTNLGVAPLTLSTTLYPYC